MTEWFRSWHGAPTDGKWRTVAKRAGVAPHLVVSLAWVLMDRASQAEQRGSIDGIDIETVADFLGCESEEIERIITAMHDKSVLVHDRFAAWERRQPKREREDDTAAERKAAERARKAAKNGSGNGGTEDVTSGHDASHDVTPCHTENGQNREEQNRLDLSSSLRSEAAAPAPAVLPPDEDRDLFRRGREVLGQSAGGQVRKLKDACGGSIADARSVIERASTRDDAAAFVAGAIRRMSGEGGFNRGSASSRPTRGAASAVAGINFAFDNLGEFH